MDADRQSRKGLRKRFLTDPHVIEVALLGVAATLITGGLVYVAYLAHVARIAHTARTRSNAGSVFVFGKFSPNGTPDPDFTGRIRRAAEHHLVAQRDGASRRWILLGGGEPGSETEADIAHRHIMSIAPCWDGADVTLETRSRNTLQNFSESASLVGTGRTALLTSRYHLARCAMHARHMGVEHDLLAAEDRMRWTPATTARVAGEAGYVMLLDLGFRWATITGNRAMKSRLTGRTGA